MRAYVPDDAAQCAVASVCAVFEPGSRWPDWRPGVKLKVRTEPRCKLQAVVSCDRIFASRLAALQCC